MNNIHFRDHKFIDEYTHNGDSECIYCYLNFKHIHPIGTTLKNFIYIGDDNNITSWENKFDDFFDTYLSKNSNVTGWTSTINVKHAKEKLKDFIRKEFLN